MERGSSGTLARLFQGKNPPWLFKGGYAMEPVLNRPAPRAISPKEQFAEMAKECGFPEGITPRFATVQTFLQPILIIDIQAP